MKIHPLEGALVWVIGGLIVFEPWAIGGMPYWSQIVAMIWSGVALVLALLPRNYTEEHTGAARFRLILWPRLVRFPLFWTGLAVLAVVTIQGLNPAWTYETDGKGWWMKAIDHVSWLPSGVRVPLERWGPWRMLLIYASVWSTVCAVWTGLTRRRSVQLLFMTIGANGLALAVFGIAQKIFGATKIFGLRTSENPSFFSSFVYKNHAGAYLFLTLVTTCGFAGWYYLRGLRRLEKSNPSGVLMFFATCTAIGILVSYARGATLITLVFLCAVVASFAVHQLLTPREDRKPVVAIVLILVFGYFLRTGLETLHSREAWSRLKTGIMEEDRSLASRELATKASLDMYADYWAKGAGTGSLPFLFPLYQQRYPDLVEYAGRRLFWNHAHNDVLEIPIELGLSGTLLIVGSIVFLGFKMARSFFWQNPLSGCIVFGEFLMVVYAWWDFPFQDPAVLLTWCILLVAAAMWSEFEGLNVKG